MNIRRSLTLSIALAGLGLAAWMALTLLMLGSTLTADEQSSLMALLWPRAALLGLSWALALALMAWALKWLHDHYVRAPARLLEQAQALLVSDACGPLPQEGSAQTRALAQVLQSLASQRAKSGDVMPHDIDQARHELDLDTLQFSDAALDQRPLQSLTCTVFDAETTGLRPSKGDEIIQLGAVRIVSGRLLQHEVFDQLIDPQRPIGAASQAIHGISQQMVKGQPTIDQVLPLFHAYARDSVLVAHNAAFDMRFLQCKEAQTGLVFDMPVLDTLLLSAWLHPHQASHRLEDIARRLGIAVTGRHTALGDALVTAQVFLRLLPLLQTKGIITLRQARDAERQTALARLRY